jgi:hypothetical protein
MKLAKGAIMAARLTLERWIREARTSFAQYSQDRTLVGFIGLILVIAVILLGAIIGFAGR